MVPTFFKETFSLSTSFFNVPFIAVFFIEFYTNILFLHSERSKFRRMAKPNVLSYMGKLNSYQQFYRVNITYGLLTSFIIRVIFFSLLQNLTTDGLEGLTGYY